ncbi:MAG: hypothetical protein U0521_16090 [Anaerolineae bacterium]
MTAKRLIGIPLLCMALLVASCTFNNTVFQALVQASFPPTGTPSVQIASVSERLNFAAGSTSAQVTGQIDGTSIHTYFVEARAGQRMQARVASPYSNVYLTVVSPSGSPLARAQAGAQSFDGTLPESGDYVLQVSAPVGTPATTYLLNVSITGGVPTSTPIPPQYVRIRFATGATSAQVNGQVDGTSFRGYLLEARAGQRMQITVTSPTGNAYLTVVSPSGSPLARAQNGVQIFDQTLPESGDYRLEVSAPSGTPLTNFTLFVSVTNTSSGGTTQRISFPAGMTWTQVTGHISGLTMNNYLLAAVAGQSMLVFVSSPSNDAYLTVVSPGGSAAGAGAGGRAELQRHAAGDGRLPDHGFVAVRDCQHRLHTLRLGDGRRRADDHAIGRHAHPLRTRRDRGDRERNHQRRQSRHLSARSGRGTADANFAHVPRRQRLHDSPHPQRRQADRRRAGRAQSRSFPVGRRRLHYSGDDAAGHAADQLFPDRVDHRRRAAHQSATDEPTPDQPAAPRRAAHQLSARRKLGSGERSGGRLHRHHLPARSAGGAEHAGFGLVADQQRLSIGAGAERRVSGAGGGGR